MAIFRNRDVPMIKTIKKTGITVPLADLFGCIGVPGMGISG
jgi:hypothetical protein